MKPGTVMGQFYEFDLSPDINYIAAIGERMADLGQKWKENKAGKMFVDQSCIACDACVLTAPKNFGMHEEDGHAFVTKQPETQEEEAACKEAMEGCPVEAIGDFGDQG